MKTMTTPATPGPLAGPMMGPMAGPLVHDRKTSAGSLTDVRGVYIDGAWHEPEHGWFEDRCATTGETISDVPNASPDQVGAAVAAARKAADTGDWPSADPAFRSRCLSQLAQALEDARHELVALGRVEWGCTADEDRQQIDAPAMMAMGGSQMALAPIEEALAAGGATGKVLVRHEPVGVVSVLTPWNFPHTLNLMKLAPALAAGNTVVLKPSPLAPLVGLAVADLADRCTDLPPGVLNVVSTEGLEASQVLVTDPRVDMVSFTGATATGRQIMSMAGETLKRLLLELGGKSATVVLDGTDLDALLPRLLYDGCTFHAGQACILRSRLLVPRPLLDATVTGLADLARAVVVGDPLDPATQMGPLISTDQAARVAGLVDRARQEGAVVAAGGSAPRGLEGTSFFAPTVLSGVDPRSEIAQSEVFGPVLCVVPYDDIDDAVALANDSAYGLAGSVWGPDDEVALAVARRMRTGQVEVNGTGLGGSPFGGFKQSGFGREGGLIGLRSYTETKAIGFPA